MKDNGFFANLPAGSLHPSECGNQVPMIGTKTRPLQTINLLRRFFIQTLSLLIHILHSLDLLSAVAHVSSPPTILGRTNIMKVDSMLKHLRPALLLLLFLSLITGVLYPLVVTGISQAVFPSKANGSIIEKNGQPVGSSLIGQQLRRRNIFGAGYRRPVRSRTMPPILQVQIMGL